ncbi:MAG: lamin tail domain-containing protein, partial [Planctomycetota bacterium]
MYRRLILSVIIGLLPGLVNNSSAFPLKVDIGDIGQPVKSGWEEFSGDGDVQLDPKTEIYDVYGLSITVSLRAWILDDSDYRDYGGGDLGGDMMYPDLGTGPMLGRLALTLSNLPADDYVLTSYHNDSDGGHAQQDPINVTVMGAISGSTPDLGVIQTKSLDDSGLGRSTVTFTANGTGDVTVIYAPTTNNGEVSKAVLNGFELDAGDIRVEFASEASSGFENVSPAVLSVILSRATPNTVTVDYNVTGGTALNGEDYSLSYGTLVFDPCEVTKNISITIVNDGFEEDPDETIEITLLNPSNAKLGVNTQHTFMILPPMVQVCPKGDLDGDCDVDFNDLRVFSGQWLDPPGCSDFNCADMDGNNGVDLRDFAMLAGSWEEGAWPVVINEFMASNNATIQDPQDDWDDWIEIYNGSGAAVDIGGMWLEDEQNQWMIPDDEPAETTIAPGGYVLIWADNDTLHSPGLHAGFALSKNGDKIELYASDGVTLIDSISFEDQVSDISYGCYPDAGDNLRFFATPTPGARNVGAYDGAVSDTKFSHDRGFYESPFNLSITSATAGAEIHYTLDGSEPNEFIFPGNGTYLYTSSINISQTTCLRAVAFKPGWLQTDVDTQTYIFLSDVVSQPDMDPGVVAMYSSVIEDAFKSVPTLSIGIDEDDLANLQAQDSRYPPTGLPKKELPVSVELIYADANDGEGFRINCGIEGHSWALNKRSCKLIFKSKFGPTQLRYPFFESAPVNGDSAVDEFDRIVLRASKNMPITYAGDQWTRDSEIAMSGASARGTYVHLYFNGTYWGLYNATERPDAWFTSSYFGGENEDYFATNHGIERGEDHISGDSSRFDTMISMAQARDLEVPGNYETFKG